MEVRVKEGGERYAATRGLYVGSGRGLSALRERLARIDGTETDVRETEGW